LEESDEGDCESISVNSCTDRQSADSEFSRILPQDHNASFAAPAAIAMATNAKFVKFPEELQDNSPVITVRNTFIDIDIDSPSIARMRQRPGSKTLPACSEAFVLLDENDEGDCECVRSYVNSSIGSSATDSDGLSPETHEDADLQAHRRTCALPAAAAEATSTTCAEFPDVHMLAESKVDPQDKSGTLCTPQGQGPNQVRTWTRCHGTGRFDACWVAAARKLQSTDKQAVSPAFEVPLGQNGGHVKLRLVLRPNTSRSNHALNFKKTKGCGYIQVKCESISDGVPASVNILLSIGREHCAQATRGPFWHNFRDNSIFALHQNDEKWDFSSAVDTKTMTVPVLISITPAFDIVGDVNA